MRYAHFLKRDGVIICNNQRIDPMTVTTGKAAYPRHIIENLSEKYKVVSLDAMEEAKKLGNAKVFKAIPPRIRLVSSVPCPPTPAIIIFTVSIIIIRVAARHMNFQKEKWEEVIKNTVPPKTVEINLKAFQTGYEWSN